MPPIGMGMSAAPFSMYNNRFRSQGVSLLNPTVIIGIMLLVVLIVLFATGVVSCDDGCAAADDDGAAAAAAAVPAGDGGGGDSGGSSFDGPYNSETLEDLRSLL